VVRDAVSRQLLHTEDGNTLEAIIDEPDSPLGTIVLCHPHPLHGGTMRAPLLIAVGNLALDTGYRVLRFNFRGVGASTGEFGDGIGEMNDISAAMAYASGFDEPVQGICGWSFGAATALRWQAHTKSRIPYVGIAPPVASTLAPLLPNATELAQTKRRFIIGERDQFIEPASLAAYAESIGAEFLQYRSTDHFFVFRYDRLALDVVDGFGR
jgi:alpha/beta superfamily hydrolase